MSEAELPAPKRPRRLVRAERVVSSTEEQGIQELVFDKLPEYAIDNVVRYLSDSPRAENWPLHIRCNILGL